MCNIGIWYKHCCATEWPTGSYVLRCDDERVTNELLVTALSQILFDFLYVKAKNNVNCLYVKFSGEMK